MFSYPEALIQLIHVKVNKLVNPHELLTIFLSLLIIILQLNYEMLTIFSRIAFKIESLIDKYGALEPV